MRPIEIRRTQLFASAAPDDVIVAASAARTFRYPRRTRLYSAGDACGGVAEVLDGFVRLFRVRPDGTEISTGIVRPGGLLTIAALRGQNQHDDNAEALSSVRTVELPAATLLAIGRGSPAVLTGIVHGLVFRSDHANGETLARAREAMPARLVRVLRSLARSDAPNGTIAADTMRQLAVRLSHEDLARLVGSDRETVTRSLQVLETSGLVRRDRGHVTGVALGTVSTNGRPR